MQKYAIIFLSIFNAPYISPNIRWDGCKVFGWELNTPDIPLDKLELFGGVRALPNSPSGQHEYL
jgi:hypothetical protein